MILVVHYHIPARHLGSWIQVGGGGGGGGGGGEGIFHGFAKFCSKTNFSG